jgi:hypothetical protein
VAPSRSRASAENARAAGRRAADEPG